MTSLQMYLIVVLGRVSILCIIVTILLALTLGVLFVIWTTDTSENFVLLNIRRVVIALCIFAFCSALVPDTKQAAAIWLIPKIVNNQTLIETTDEVGQILRGLAREWATELKRTGK